MARGLLFGAAFFLGTALVMVIMILWPDSPWSTWLMEKTELGDDFCWFGEGIWRTNMVWGESKKGLNCWKHGLHESDALDAYCLNDNYGQEMFSDEVRMCRTTKWGRFFMSFGAVLSFMSALLMLAVHFTRSLATRELRVKRALFILTLAFLSQLALFIAMAISPLFESFHFHYLGRHNRVQYKGLGCVFQSPFVGGPLSLISSSPLKCLYPGPAFPLSIGIVIMELMSILMLALLLFDTRRAISDEAQQAGVPGKQVRSSTKDYYYSLHGALIRRLVGFHRLEQNLAGILLPMIVTGSAMLLISWFYHGMQFVVHVRVHNHSSGSREHPSPIPLPDIPIVELKEQVFTFDPVTTLKDFWDSEAYLLTVITAFWLDFFPFLKVFIWLFYWFVPQSELLRGRVLTWIDYLGRWSLANLLTLCIISSAFLFQTQLRVPIPLPDKQTIIVEIECLVQSGAGVTWFIMCMLWTIALGNLLLTVHTISRHWEDARRKSLPAGSATTPREDLESSRVPLLFNDVNDQSSGRRRALEEDTPCPTPEVPPSSSDSTTDLTPDQFIILDGRTVPRPNDPAVVGAASQQIPPTSRGGRTSLFRELVRRTSTQFLIVSSRSGPKQSLSDGIFGPFNDRKHTFSQGGKIVLWISLIVIFILELVSLFHVPFIKLNRQGAVPDVLLNERDSEWTVKDLVSKIVDMGGTERPAYELALAFVFFTFVFPLLHTLTLMVLWGYPLTVRRQQMLFRFCEFCDAWNALDVFFAATLVVWVGLETISKRVVEIVVPGLTAAARTLFREDNVYVIIPTVQNGLWLIGIALLGQKLTSHVLMELSAASIAQRQFQLDRAQIISTPNGDNRQIMVQEQTILSPDELLMFSPANRYVGVSSTQTAKVLYAGVPHWVWRGGQIFGLLRVQDD